MFFVAPAMILAVPCARAEPDPFRVEPAMVGVEDAFPVARGRTEVEVSYLFSTADKAFDDDGDTFRRDHNTVHAGVFTATHGFTNSLDARVGIAGGRSRDDDEPERSFTGMGDLFVSAKWRFFGEGDDGLHLAYRPGMSIPVGEQDDDKNLSTGLGYWTFDQQIIATLIARRWVGGIAAGFALPFGDREGARGFLGADLGLGYQLTTWLKPEVELNYAHDFAADRRNGKALAASVGAIMNVGDAVRIDLGLRHDFYGRNADRRLSVIANFLWAF